MSDEGWRHELGRLRWTMRTRLSTVARLRWLFWRHIMRYEMEMCHDCGRRVGPDPFSFWHADDELWMRVQGNVFGVLCPACFTRLADLHGVKVSWAPVVDRCELQRVDQGTIEHGTGNHGWRRWA